ncbi:type II toxin-antitoxin system PemK/MazF family toxin [Clostridium perfringens]|nr:type II toxin-antitoxin system PemK/MazF family toxin [Clostridium perfringens]
MKYKKGQIVEYDFPKINNNNDVLEGEHKAVVLHSRETPYKTILIAPITSAEALKRNDKIPKNYVELKVENYLGVLKHDSYINLDMIFPVDEVEIAELERYSKKIYKELISEDQFELDFKLTVTYQLEKFLTKQVSSEVENIIEHIDTNVKSKIQEALNVIQDEEVMKVITYIIENDLIKVLKEEYCNNKNLV